MNEASSHKIQAEKTNRLRQESERLRIEFANADLDIAMTFVQLARMDFETGESENAVRLLSRAERAADQIAGMLDPVTGDAAEVIRARLGTLISAIGEVKNTGS